MQSYEGPTREPLHDIHSHCADAFRTMAVSIRQPQKEREKEQRLHKQYVSPWS